MTQQQTQPSGWMWINIISIESQFTCACTSLDFSLFDYSALNDRQLNVWTDLVWKDTALRKQLRNYAGPASLKGASSGTYQGFKGLAISTFLVVWGNHEHQRSPQKKKKCWLFGVAHPMNPRAHTEWEWKFYLWCPFYGKKLEFWLRSTNPQRNSLARKCGQ